MNILLSRQQNWRALKGRALLAQVIEGFPFKDGLQVARHSFP
jgi:hypothetical protein